MANDLEFSVGYKELEKALEATRKGFGKVSDAVEDFDKDTSKAFTDAEKATSKLAREHKRLTNQIKNAKPEDDVKKLKKELEATEREMLKLGKRTKSAFGDVKQSTGELKGSATDLMGSLKSAFAVTAVFEFGRKVKEIADEVHAVERKLKTFGLTAKDELGTATKKVLVLAKAFDEDRDEIIKTANVIKDRWGVSFTEALENIDEAYSKGANVRGQYNEQIQEFADYFKEAGLSIKQTNAYLTYFEKKGIVNDKAADALHEFVVATKELTPTTKKALNDVGINTREMQKKLVSGQMTYFEYMQLVSRKMSEFGKDSQQYGALIADVWKGAGEDGGIFVDILKDLDTNFDNYNSTLSDHDKANRRLLTNWTELTVNATKGGTAIDQLYTGILNFAADAVAYFQRLIDNAQPLMDVFEGIGDEGAALVTEVEKLLKSLGFLSGEGDSAKTVMEGLAGAMELATTPVRFLVSLYTDLFAAINKLVEGSPALQKQLSQTKTRLGNLIDTLRDAPNYLRGFSAAGKAAFIGFRDMAYKTLSGVGKLLLGLLTFDAAKVSEGFAQSKETVENYGEAISDAFIIGFNKGKNKIKTVVEVETVTNETVNKTTTTTNKNKGGKPSGKLTAEEKKAIAAKALERRRLEIEAQEDGLKKELALMDFAHAQRLKKFKSAQIDTSNIERDYQKKRLKKIRDYLNAGFKAEEAARDKAYTKRLEDFDAQQRLKKAEFALTKHTETEKTRFELEQQKARLEFLRQNAQGKTAIELAELDALITGMSQKIEQLKSKERDEGISGWLKRSLGIDDEGLQAIEEAAAVAVNYISELTAAQVEHAEATVSALEEQIAAQEEKVAEQKRLDELGKANELQTEQEKLANLKAQRKAALKDSEKAKKQQLIIDSAVQASSMITATAKIWSSTIYPWVAMPMIAVMWGSFLASKVQAFETAKAQGFAEGVVNLKGGVKGKDSIPAMLMPGETVFTTKQTSDNLELFEGIYNNDRMKVLRGTLKLLNDFGMFGAVSDKTGRGDSYNFDDSGIRQDLQGISDKLNSGVTYERIEGGFIRREGNLTQYVYNG